MNFPGKYTAMIGGNMFGDLINYNHENSDYKR